MMRAPVRNADEIPRENNVKAAWLFKLHPVRDVAAADDSPRVIGLLGRAPFGENLDRMLKTKAPARGHVLVFSAKLLRVVEVTNSEEP